MDQQHPIPQQISSYQFRLVGNMTLKQFFQIAGGALLSLLIYASNLHPIIKWPLVILFALFGAALAFLPFEERPLEQWVIAFFRAVYSPTIFLWKRTKKPTVFFKEEAAMPEAHIVAPHGEVELEKYLKTLPGRGRSIFGKLEEAEQAFLTRMSGLFGGGIIPPTPQPQTQAQAAAKKKEEMQIPRNLPTTVVPQGFRPKVVVEERATLQPTGPTKPATTAVAPTFASQGSISGQAAQFSIDAAPPLPPEKPNTVTGQVMTPEAKIVENAILEIKDVAERPVRAVKTNKAGHFQIVTPLQDGKYEIVTEKEGLIFKPIIFEATGKIIPPIAVRAASQQKPTVVN